VKAKISIRTATDQDAATVAELNIDVQRLHANALPWRFKQPSPTDFTADEALALMRQPDHFTLLANVGEKAVGYLLGEVMRQTETSRRVANEMIYVHHISVRESARGMGAGRALVEAAQAHGKSLGISRIACDTWTFNADALAFFEKLGLVPFNIKFWKTFD
jgi:ribosomal protein S18 acetylase RimI-like enzyme